MTLLACKEKTGFEIFSLTGRTVDRNNLKHSSGNEQSKYDICYIRQK